MTLLRTSEKSSELEEEGGYYTPEEMRKPPLNYSQSRSCIGATPLTTQQQVLWASKWLCPSKRTSEFLKCHYYVAPRPRYKQAGKIYVFLYTCVCVCGYLSTPFPAPIPKPDVIPFYTKKTINPREALLDVCRLFLETFRCKQKCPNFINHPSTFHVGLYTYASHVAL